MGPKLAIDNIVLALTVEPGGECLQFMRDNWLSNRIFKSYEDTACGQAWNNPSTNHGIMSLGMRKWAHGLINDRWYNQLE